MHAYVLAWSKDGKQTYVTYWHLLEGKWNWQSGERELSLYVLFHLFTMKMSIAYIILSVIFTEYLFPYRKKKRV